MRKPPVPFKPMRRLAEELTDSCIEACMAEGTIGEASGVMVLDGDYSVNRYGEFNLDVGAETNVPTDPVAGNTKVGWLAKRKRDGIGTLRVEFAVKVRTAT